MTAIQEAPHCFRSDRINKQFCLTEVLKSSYQNHVGLWTVQLLAHGVSCVTLASINWISQQCRILLTFRTASIVTNVSSRLLRFQSWLSTNNPWRLLLQSYQTGSELPHGAFSSAGSSTRLRPQSVSFRPSGHLLTHILASSFGIQSFHSTDIWLQPLFTAGDNIRRHRLTDLSER